MHVAKVLKTKLVYSLFFCVLLLSPSLSAQVTIGSSEEPHSSAVLELKSNDKGLLINRVNLKGRKDVTTISNPAHGLLVYNLSNGDNGTPEDDADDVLADNFYIYTTKSNEWLLLIDNNYLERRLANMRVPQFILLASVGNKDSGNTTSFLSSVEWSNIRKMYFTNELYDLYNAYDPVKSEFVAPFSGYYHFEANVFLRAHSKNQEINRLGVSVPYEDGYYPAKEGDNYYSNASFALLNQPKNAVLDKTTDPLTIIVSGVVYIPKGKRVCILTRYITPSTSTSVTDAYSLDTEDLFGVNREEGNRFTVTYYPNM